MRTKLITILLLAISLTACSQKKPIKNSTLKLSNGFPMTAIPPDGSKKYPMQAKGYKYENRPISEVSARILKEKPIEIKLDDSTTVHLTEVDIFKAKRTYKAGFCFYNAEGEKITLIAPEKNSFDDLRWSCFYEHPTGVKFQGYIHETEINIDLHVWLYVPFVGRYYECKDCESETRSFYTK